MINPLRFLAIFFTIIYSSPIFSQENILINGSFESGLFGWNASGINRITPQVADDYFPAPNGNWIVEPIDSSQCDTAFSMDLTQQLPELRALTRYRASVEVYPINGGNHRLSFMALDASTTFDEFGSQIYRPPWNNEQQTLDLIANQWNQISFEFSSMDVIDFTGNPFFLRIQACDLLIDHVTLSAIPMSEGAPDTNYFISSSVGDDSNDGTTADSPWKTFEPVKNIYLSPGNHVLLKRDDTWNESLMLRGLGTTNQPIVLGSYGEGNRPHLIMQDREHGRGITIQNASNWIIREMQVSDAKLGLYLRYYLSSGNENVTVEDCLFQDMDSWTVDTPGTNFEVSFNTGLFIGGKVGSQDQTSTVLSGLNVRNVGFENCTAGILFGWYFPELIYDRVTNVTIEDTYATKVSAGGLMLNSVDTATVRRFRTLEPLGRDDNFIWGSTGGIISSSRNILIEDSEFSETDRMWFNDEEGDGCGLDIDGRNQNVTVRDTVFHNNDAPGLLFLGTYGIANSNITIENCVMYNNGLDGAVTFGGNAWEIKVAPNTLQAGVFRNLGLYRSAPSLGWILNEIPTAVTLENIRQNRFQEDVASRPTPNWQFNQNGNLEGWTIQNHLGNVEVSNGSFSATSTDIDPYLVSPEIWINTHRQRAVIVRMKIDQPSIAQVFFTRETDPFFDGEKQTAFELLPDDQFHTYQINLRGTESYKGVVTQLRLDPTFQVGANVEIDEIRVIEKTTVEIPDNVINLQARQLSQSEIELNWQNPQTPIDHVVIEKMIDSEFVWKATLPSNATDFTENNLDSMIPHHYRIRTFNEAGFSFGVESEYNFSNISGNLLLIH